MHLAYFAEHEREDTDTFLKGRGFHSVVLQGIVPKYWEGRRFGSAYDDAVAANDGVDLLTVTAYDEVMRMAEAVRKSRLAMDVLSRCPNRETYLEWERDGVDCAGTIDAHGPEDVAELKSTKCAHPYRFKRDANWHRYPEQLVWYDVGLGTKINQDEPELTRFRRASIIAVEPKAPWPVTVISVTPLRLVQANGRCVDWLARYKQCVRDGYWPGWDEGIEELDIDFDVTTIGEEEE